MLEFDVIFGQQKSNWRFQKNLFKKGENPLYFKDYFVRDIIRRWYLIRKAMQTLNWPKGGSVSVFRAGSGIHAEATKMSSLFQTRQFLQSNAGKFGEKFNNE